MAGWPVTLKGAASMEKTADRVKPWSGLSGRGAKSPRGGGGSPATAESSRSKPALPSSGSHQIPLLEKVQSLSQQVLNIGTLLRSQVGADRENRENYCQCHR